MRSPGLEDGGALFDIAARSNKMWAGIDVERRIRTNTTTEESTAEGFGFEAVPVQRSFTSYPRPVLVAYGLSSTPTLRKGAHSQQLAGDKPRATVS